MKKTINKPSDQFTEAQIAERAYFVFVNRCENNIPGDSDTDWLQAEALLQAEAGTKTPPKARRKSTSAKASVKTSKSKSKPKAKAKATTPAKKEDLTKIKGLGPVYVKKLAALKVTKFAQIAKWTKADIEKFDEKLAAKGRIVREKWIPQAKKLAK